MKSYVFKQSNKSEQFNLEWLDVNGLGGWASSTVSNCNTRTYHGLLVAAISDPTNRVVLLSRLDEILDLDKNSYQLASRDFGDCLYPQGFNFLQSFSSELCPCWIYEGPDFVFKKELLCIKDSNAICIKYELLNASQAKLKLEPFVAFRNYHSTLHSSSGMSVNFRAQENQFTISNSNSDLSLSFCSKNLSYTHNPCWHYNFFYKSESERGLQDREDLLQIGQVELKLKSGEPVYLLISSDPIDSADPKQVFLSEILRRENIFDSKLQNQFVKKLTQAASSFIVKRAEYKTILAGYHWFADWGRDTLISLRGLCFTTGKLDQAEQILSLFCQHIKDGLIPNRFVESGEEPEYNSVDASLWLAVVAYDFLRLSKNKNFSLNVLMPALESIFRAFSSGTKFNIHETEDGLIYAGDDSVQLTWMDAKIGDWVVTPRNGKAIDINALWYNFLNVLMVFADEFNRADLLVEIKNKIEVTKKSIQSIFYNSDLKCLYDVIKGEHKDPSIRPNQIFAIGLEFSALTETTAKEVIKIVRTELLTPVGLRTLSPKDNAYRGKYEGSPFSRDSAYHQGTVWPWLLGLYVDAIFKYENESAREEAQMIVRNIAAHLDHACIGSISEIFDGDYPHLPRGAISQAWSVAELLRVSQKYNLFA